MPDGWYVVRVEATDEPDNPDALALRDTADSEPIRVDNHAPVIEALREAGGRLSGRAMDALGPIAQLEYAFDGGEWHALFPTDDLFDTADERFAVDLTRARERRPHRRRARHRRRRQRRLRRGADHRGG